MFSLKIGQRIRRDLTNGTNLEKNKWEMHVMNAKNMEMPHPIITLRLNVNMKNVGDFR